jgi:HSP20 family protein
MIERYDPFRQMMSLRQMMDRLFEDAFVMPREGQMSAAEGTALDVYEEGNNLVVEAHLPGMKPEEVDVTVEGGMLTIRGETKSEQERKDRNYLIREHRQGSFARSVRLPDNIDPDKVQANFDNGVLRIEFPRPEQTRAKRIQLTSGRGQATGGGEKEQKTQRAA